MSERKDFRPFWRDHPYLTAVALLLCLPVMLAVGAINGARDYLRDWIYEWTENWRTR